MRYSYEHNRKCVKMYRNGLYPETPEGINTERFHGKIRKWWSAAKSVDMFYAIICIE